MSGQFKLASESAGPTYSSARFGCNQFSSRQMRNGTTGLGVREREREMPPEKEQNK